jgi:DNA-binding LytR/AlgR family response regulator
MKCLIIEDEKVAAERLKNQILQYDENIRIPDIIQSVKQAVQWFNKNPPPNLAFMDIQLSDGLSFEIFSQTIVSCPVIFTTAYDEYALQAFKVNSIDYLLKPISFDELSRAIKSFEESPYNKDGTEETQTRIFDKVLKSLTNEYKTKFVVKVGEHIRLFPTDSINCFYSMEKATFLQNNEGRDYAINYSLDQLEELLDPEAFFRINRQYIVHSEAIADIRIYSGTRLLIKLHSGNSDDLIVSRERVNAFKEWLER